ncbi:equilibrative nucleobase transporter 1-like [Tubulanus polymorphus]|uniref:equilibrative nucleobase transporter 1-like n=1 Tax=Tubulanus polymorphus TaxID=672921 RepID=UPI003DA29EF4
MENCHRNERMKNIFAFLFGWVECLIFAGSIFGWVPLVFVLKQDGVYSHLCNIGLKNGSDTASDSESSRNETSFAEIVTNDDNNTSVAYSTCLQQNDMLMLVFSIGVAALCCSAAVIGWLLDKHGTRVTRITIIIIFASGCLMLGFASPDVPVLVFPGLAGIGIGGVGLLATNMQIGNYFDTARLTVVTLYSSSYDISGFVMLIMKHLHGKGVKRLHYFIVLCVLSVVMVSISTFALLPKFKIFPKDHPRGSGKNRSNDDADAKVGYIAGTVLVEDERNKTDEIQTSYEPKVDERKVKALTYYLFSRVYLLELMWEAIIQLQFFYYMGTLNPMLTRFTKNDVDKVSFFTNIFSYILLGGIFLGPLEGLFLHLEKKRLHRDNPNYYDQIRPAALPQAFCSFVCLLLSVLVLIPVEGLLYVQFICLVVFRAFLFGLSAAFLFMAFPVEHFGRLFGSLRIINGGIIGMLQYPLFKWGEGPPINYLPPSLFMIVGVVLSFLQPLSVMFGERIDQLTRWCRPIKQQGILTS